MNSKARILVIEDVDFSRKAVVSMLNGLQCTADSASTGQEALEKLNSNPYDLVLVDINLRDMEGMTFAETARYYESKVPMIALTSYPDELIRAEALHSGMNDFIAKPLTFNKAKILLGKWCKKYAHATIVGV